MSSALALACGASLLWGCSSSINTTADDGRVSDGGGAVDVTLGADGPAGGDGPAGPCATSDIKCGAHASCWGGTGRALCRCDPGYMGDGQSCVTAQALSGFVAVAAGSFTMGSPAAEPGRQAHEGPQHAVTLTRGFEMLDHELTQGEYKRVLGLNPSFTPACGDECPVEQITWYDALALANALSYALGHQECYSLGDCYGTLGDGLVCNTVSSAGLACDGYRLPTEAEWEYAARAGTTTMTHGGDVSADALGTCGQPTLDAICWYLCTLVNVSALSPVKHKQPNAWGLYDMPGNAREWTWDRYDAGYYATSPATDPTGPSSGAERAVRSASLTSYGSECRSAQRQGVDPSQRSNAIGLRLVRTK